jgi:xylitol oxidase
MSPRLTSSSERSARRPHWGKLFAMAPRELHAKYSKLYDFVRLAAKLDPCGKFRNEFLDSNLFNAR